jgi:hypothetical protein
MFPVESVINLELRLDPIQEYIQWGFIAGDQGPDYKLMESVQLGVAKWGTLYPTELGDLYRYNSAYSSIDKSKEFYPRPFDFEQNLTDDVRITASDKKINGEYTDSWTKFRFNNYIDVDSKHHSITRIYTFKNNLFYFQPTGVGVVSVNQRSLIQDNQPGQLTLGTGGILTRFDYVTEQSGSTFHDGITSSDTTIYYIDGRRKRFNKLLNSKELAISTIEGIESTLDNKTFSSGIVGFDKGFNEVIFSIDNSLTISYNEAVQSFISEYTFNPKIMLSIGNNFFSVGNGLEGEVPALVNSIDLLGYSGDDDADPSWDYILIGDTGSSEVFYKHNVGNKGEFYGGDGGPSDSYITLIINPNGNIVNIFDNLDMRTESKTVDGTDVVEDTFYRLEANNDYQELTRELGFVNNINESTGNIKRISRVWRTPILPAQTAGADFYRMRDTYIKVTLRYDNDSNNTFRVHDITTLYRPTKV